MLWNGAMHHRPAVVVLCESVLDVQAAIRAARTHRLPLSVRGGGHDWAGPSPRQAGLVIDLVRMRQVTVTGRVATAQGGATSLDVLTAAGPHGLSAVTGSIGSVGITGLTLGGRGNFGVVTALNIRRHPVDTPLAGAIMFGWDQTASVLAGLAEVLRTTPDRLTVPTGILSAPDGNAAVFVLPAWSGDEQPGLTAIDTRTALGPPIMPRSP